MALVELILIVYIILSYTLAEETEKINFNPPFKTFNYAGNFYK